MAGGREAFDRSAFCRESIALSVKMNWSTKNYLAWGDVAVCSHFFQKICIKLIFEVSAWILLAPERPPTSTIRAQRTFLRFLVWLRCFRYSCLSWRFLTTVPFNNSTGLRERLTGISPGCPTLTFSQQLTLGAQEGAAEHTLTVTEAWTSRGARQMETEWWRPVEPSQWMSFASLLCISRVSRDVFWGSEEVLGFSLG